MRSRKPLSHKCFRARITLPKLTIFVTSCPFSTYNRTLLTKTVFTQFLLSYKVNPQTVIFLGYSDNAQGMLRPDLTRTDLTRFDRTFFLKLGYAWRP